MTTKKRIFVLALVWIMYCLGGIRDTVMVAEPAYENSSGETDLTLTNTRSTGLKIASRETLYYEGYNSSHFVLSNGATAFCMEYDYTYAPEGQTIKETLQYSADTGSMAYRLLYYGWGGPEQWSGFMGDKNIGVTATSLLLSYITTGSPDYVFKNSTYQQFYDYVSTAPLPPSGSMSFSPSEATVSVENGVQKTSTITFQTDSRLSAKLYLEEDIVLYFQGEEAPHTGVVDLTGGDKFYLTAPLTRKTSFNPTVTYSGDKIFTVMQAIPLYVETGYQKMAYRANKAVSASFVAEFKEFKGKLKLTKVSGNENITNNNECYDLTGVVFGIFNSRQEAESATADNEKSVGTIVIDEWGIGYSPELPYGTYYIKETKTGANYLFDDTVYEITVPSEYSISNAPISDDLDLLINKVDEDGAALEGAQFAVKYYDIQQNKENMEDPAVFGMEPKKIWYFESDESGKVYLSDSHKVGGDELYYNTVGVPTIPIGTITIQEIKAPEGYKLEDKVFVQTVEDGQKMNKGHFYNSFSISNEAIPPSMVTQARDSQSQNNTAKVSANTILIDSISYEDVLVNKEYTIKAVLMDKSTEKPIVVDGQEIRKNVTFCPTEAVGSVEVDLAFDSTDLYDQKVVFYEELYLGDRLVITHTDINNQAQTITFESLTGQIRIHKRGEKKAFDEETGDYITKEVGLKDIEFGIYAAEDIVDKDNNIIFCNGELIEIIITDSDGNAASSFDLPLGKYRIHEENTPAEYISADDCYVELSEYSSKEWITDASGEEIYVAYENISVKNMLKPEEPPITTEEPPVTTEIPPELPPDTPVTGDRGKLGLVIGLMSVCLLGGVMYFIKFRKLQ